MNSSSGDPGSGGVGLGRSGGTISTLAGRAKPREQESWNIKRLEIFALIQNGVSPGQVAWGRLCTRRHAFRVTILHRNISDVAMRCKYGILTTVGSPS